MVQIYDTMKDMWDFSETIEATSVYRKRLRKALENLNTEVANVCENKFANDVLVMAKEVFGNITATQVLDILSSQYKESKSQDEEFYGKRCVPVKQYTLDGKYIARYSSISEAARQVGARVCSISAAIKGRSHSSAGFIWKREDDKSPVNSCVVKRYNYPIPVKQQNADGSFVRDFPSICKAAEAMHVSKSTMRGVLDQDKLLGNFKWVSLEQ